MNCSVSLVRDNRFIVHPRSRIKVKALIATMVNTGKFIYALALALLSICYVQPLFAGELIFRVEEPRSGAVMTGISNIRGWAVSSSGIDRIELYIDGEYKTDIPFGGSRKDVGVIYPEFPDSENSGYSMANNYNLKSAGPHVITIKAFDNDGAMEEVDVPYTVTRFEEPFIKNPADINILEISDVLINGGRSLTMKGVDVQGKKQDIQLEWQSPKQNFSMTSIQPSDEGQNTALDGLYSLSRLTFWYGNIPGLPDGLILDTEAAARTVDGVTFRMTGSGTLDIQGSTIFMGLKATIYADGQSESLEEAGEATLIADEGYAIDYRDDSGEIITAVLLQRGSHLIWMENFYDEPDGSNGAIVVQWQKVSEPASADAAVLRVDQLIGSDATGIAYPSIENAILQSVISAMQNSGK